MKARWSRSKIARLTLIFVVVISVVLYGCKRLGVLAIVEGDYGVWGHAMFGESVFGD